MHNRTLLIPVIAASLVVGLATSFAQITTYIGGTSSWTDSANWDPGLPTPTSNVEIDADPQGGLLEVDPGTPTEIASLGVLSGNVTTDFEIAGADTGDALLVNGNLTNDTSHTVTIRLPFTAGANATWSGNFNFGFDETSIEKRTITLATGGIGFASDGGIRIDIGTGVSDYGKFIGGFGLTMATGATVTISITGTYTGVDGDVFDFLTTGGFSGITPDLSGASLGVGLSWDTSLFATQGQLTVVPEPSTWALVFIAFAGFGILRRRTARLA